MLNEFQSTHPRGVRPAMRSNRYRRFFVSIHAPAWGATDAVFGYQNRYDVSIHAPAWGATPCCRSSIRRPPWFQSTHPRGVRLGGPAGHAPLGRRVSIHAPAWGATPAPRETLSPQMQFQSTHPRGVRLGGPAGHAPLGRRVSIHAPAWGATPAPRETLSPQMQFQSTHPRGVRRPPRARAGGRVGFNPRTRVGCDLRFNVAPMQRDEFQSTHPRGVRPGAAHARRGCCPGFNPRTRVGCDIPDSTAPATDTEVSIHAPAWGATFCWSTKHDTVRRFNPRTRVGCDRQRRLRHHPHAGFNPRTRVGCDPGPAPGVQPRQRVSIHAPAWGATGTPWPTPAWRSSFNPRTRVGCDFEWQVDQVLEAWFQSTHPRGVRPAQGGSFERWRRVSIHAPAWGATARI